MAIPLQRAGCLRVTHPSAAKNSSVQALPCSPLDLHVLGTPPAFVLSQDQTLIFDLYSLKLSLCVYFLSVLESTSLFSTFSCFHRSTFSLPCLFSYVSFSRFVGSQLVSLADSLVIVPHLLPPVNTFFKLFCRKIQVFANLRTVRKNLSFHSCLIPNIFENYM